MKQVLILNYHALAQPGEGNISGLDSLYRVSSESFKKQMEMLVRKNIALVSLSDVIHGRISENFNVAVTFDDGNQTDYSVAFPVLKQYPIPATFFVTLKHMDQAHLSWKELKEIADGGFEIGSHGIAHADMSRLSYEQAVIEFSQSKKRIEEQLEKPVHLFAFPYGIYSTRLVNMAKDAGYKALFTTNFQLNPVTGSEFVFHRWSVKPETSLTDFERIISSDPFYLSTKIITSKGKKYAMRLIGNSLATKLNILYHFITTRISSVTRFHASR